MNRLESFIASRDAECGFLNVAQLKELETIDRLCPVLVRCGGCRFTCAAQDVPHLLACIKAGGDHVRDVSLPVGSMELAALWMPESQALDTWTQMAVKPAKPTPPSVAGHRYHASDDGDYGGAFDGFTVTSDADPGL